MTWNELIHRLNDYAKNNPEILDKPAIFLDGDGMDMEIDNVEFADDNYSPSDYNYKLKPEFITIVVTE